MTQEERWQLAADWCNATDQRGEGRHPISINRCGFRYDGTGFFAPQFKNFRDAYQEVREKRLEKARAIVATGKCPECGTALIHNSAITGWWQCGAYASPGLRKPEFRELPKCSFQIFTA
jgi:hypothetical protein